MNCRCHLLTSPIRAHHVSARIIAGLAVVAAALLAVPAAQAQNVCIPNAVGVPGLWMPPNWWDDTLPQPQYWPAEDDPRWQGSFQHTPTFSGAATAHVTFRALRTASDVYFEWVVTTDPLLDNYEELWVGFSPDGVPANDVLIWLVPFSASNTSTGVPLPAPPSPTVMERNGSGIFTASATTPTWLQNANTDNRVVRSVTDSYWAVLMRVPIAAPPAGIDFNNSFKMWFAAFVSHPPALPFPQMVEYNYPPTLDMTTVLAATGTTGWADVRRDIDDVTDSSCIQGVTLAWSDIGVVNAVADCAIPGNPPPTLSLDIELDDGAGGPGTNIFCARPLNSGSSIGATDLGASFRVANWGSPPAISTMWTEINSTPVTNSVAIGTGDRGSLTYTWNLTTPDACSFTPQPPIGCGPLPPNPKQRKQCVLVELSGAAGITFPISSLWNNMNFVEASTFRREAEISVRGLAPKPTPTPQRDVYLYVQTDNLPAPRRGSLPDSATIPGQDRPARPPGYANVAGAAVPDPGGDPPGEVEPLPKDFYDELRETTPTYQVHAFHDTGRTVTLRGNTHKLLAPQTSFGYFIDHEGQLMGWRHKLEGAQEIIPGKYYKIPVPEGGAATVTTTIEAVESRWSLSIHGGINDPQGTFAGFLDGGPSTGLDLEYAFNPTFALELFLGYDEFDAPAGVPGLDVTHQSLNGKVYFLPGPNRVFLVGGVGNFDFSPGPSETGYNLGLGGQFNLWPTRALEATVKYYSVSVGGGADFEFLTYHFGARFRF